MFQTFKDIDVKSLDKRELYEQIPVINTPNSILQITLPFFEKLINKQKRKGHISKRWDTTTIVDGFNWLHPK